MTRARIQGPSPLSSHRNEACRFHHSTALGGFYEAWHSCCWAVVLPELPECVHWRKSTILRTDTWFHNALKGFALTGLSGPFDRTEKKQQRKMGGGFLIKHFFGFSGSLKWKLSWLPFKLNASIFGLLLSRDSTAIFWPLSFCLSVSASVSLSFSLTHTPLPPSFLLPLHVCRCVFSFSLPMFSLSVKDLLQIKTFCSRGCGDG